MGAIVFISSAPEDSGHRDVLEKHLASVARAGDVDLWHSGRIAPGEALAAARSKLDEAALILLLISADYLASANCHAEMLRALKRADAGLAQIVPILLRPTLADRSALDGRAMLPSDGRPVTTWTSPDDAWLNVSRGILKLLAPEQARTFPNVERISRLQRKRLNDEAIVLLAKLEDAIVRKRRIDEAGVATGEVDAEIIRYKNQLRGLGQIQQGYLIAGRYTLLQLLGRGGFSTVWEAEDRVERTRVAIKVLHPDLADDLTRTTRFIRGAKVMKKLSHPAIVRILNVLEEEGGYYCIVMEMMTGGDLLHAVIDRRVRREQVIPIVLRIGDALVATHARGYVHRDIKPANILLDAHGAPRLTDFDLVRGGDSVGGTRTGPMGTYGFAAPEVLDRPQVADARADIYGLAMTTLFCLHGSRRPETVFHNPEQLLSKLKSPEIEAVLRKATRKERDRRYSTMQKFCDALRAAHAAAEERKRLSEADEESSEGPDVDEPPGPPLFSEPPPAFEPLLASEPAPPLLPDPPSEPEAPPLPPAPPAPSKRARAWARRAVLALLLFTGVTLLVAGMAVVLHIGLFAPGSPGGPLSPAPKCPEGMVPVRGGTFEMGTAETEKVRQNDERLHEVNLSPFCIDRLEVTVAEFRTCVGQPASGEPCAAEMPSTVESCAGGNVPMKWDSWCNGAAKDREDHPMNCVDWKSAERYCRHAGKRLPTEAEWEYAARGATARLYPWGNEPPGPVWLNGCGQECRDMFAAAGSKNWPILYPEQVRDPWPSTAPVGSTPADSSAFDVLDMGGNVAEWVADWYSKEYPEARSNPIRTQPPTDEPPERVQRGYHWLGEDAQYARAAFRWAEPQNARCVTVGFRCAADPL
ncbi:MAG: SUMF1/EgtB/PvdO family nonheme iron enzyme [Polyangiaceae bacterium]